MKMEKIEHEYSSQLKESHGRLDEAINAYLAVNQRLRDLLAMHDAGDSAVAGLVKAAIAHLSLHNDNCEACVGLQQELADFGKE